MCGRTVSPFPHTHSTSKLVHPHVGKESTMTPFFIVFFLMYQAGRAALGARFLLCEFHSWGIVMWVHSLFSYGSTIHVLGCCGISFTIGVPGHLILMRRLGIHLHVGCFSFLTQLRNRCCFPHDFGFAVG